MFKLNLPDIHGAIQEIATQKNVLIVGPNGSGKSRLGS